MRSPRASVRLVTSSRSEPNWANASQLAVLGEVEACRRPATWRMALICALPPTRLTEMPTLMAGRMPE